MTDVLYALEIWGLTSLLVGWCFSRAAIRLREPSALALQRMLLAEEMRVTELTAGHERPCEPGSLMGALRIYDRA